jgi:Cu/Zn superoxide dismutase
LDTPESGRTHRTLDVETACAPAPATAAACRLLAAFGVAASLAGCAGPREVEEGAGILGRRSDTLEARLVQKGGTAARGAVRVAETAKGLELSVYFYNVPVGSYRAVVHANGNCSSPNAFSAGAPWIPPGAAGPIVVDFLVNENGADISRRVPNLTLTGPMGVSGRSAVIHWGSHGPLDAVPDAPNDRVACGVFGAVLPMPSFSF